MKTYPDKQPLVHFGVTNKLPLMRDCFNYYNGNEMVCKDIDDILMENDKEKKKLIASKAIETSKSLF
jgi:hypothetical protein